MTCSALASPRATREVLERFGLQTKKALGQHFLVDDHVVEHIIDLADIAPDDVLVEIGPGIGTLSVALLPRCRALIAIERDGDLTPVLAETCARDSDHFVLLSKDALKVSEADLRFAAAPFAAMPTALVANLPYAVAATVILDYLDRFPFIASATVMVQSEVADRISATVGTKDYGAYTTKLALRAEVTGRFEVSPNCFFPPPRVDSAVVRLQRRTPYFEGMPATEELIHAASLAADAVFCQRRKNIRNSISAWMASRGMDTSYLDAALEEAGIDRTRRGETLCMEELLRLAHTLAL